MPVEIKLTIDDFSTPVPEAKLRVLLGAALYVVAPAAYLLADTLDADGANTDDEYFEEDEENLDEDAPGVARVLAAEANRRSRSEVRRLDTLSSL